MLTTPMAITLALVIAILIGPGKGGETPLIQSTSFSAKQAPPLFEVFINIVPSNPVHAFANGKMLQIIFFVILFAIALLMTRNTMGVPIQTKGNYSAFLTLR